MVRKCPFPQKDELSESEARARAGVLKRRGAIVQAYRCPCKGHWHVGHATHRGPKRKRW